MARALVPSVGVSPPRRFAGAVENNIHSASKLCKCLFTSLYAGAADAKVAKTQKSYLAAVRRESLGMQSSTTRRRISRAREPDSRLGFVSVRSTSNYDRETRRHSSASRLGIRGDSCFCMLACWLTKLQASDEDNTLSRSASDHFYRRTSVARRKEENNMFFCAQSR